MQTTSTSLPVTSLLLAILVSAVWGFNFIMVKTGLEQLPPITLCALRFFLSACPALFFVPKPKTRFMYVLGYGLVTFALQFTLLFAGIAAGVAPGTAALLSQLQVFFAMFLAWLLLRQPVSIWHMAGASIALAGIGILFAHHDNPFSLSGFFLIVLASLCWGLGNLISVKLKDVNMFSLIVWSSLIACVPLFILAFVLESPLPLLMHPGQLKGATLLALAYITYASTYFGYSCWSWLLSRHSLASISPFALLCPVVAMFSSALILDEPLETWKLLSAFLVLAGLFVNSLGQRFFISLLLRKQAVPANETNRLAL